jgi:hypothetical protein
MVEGLTNPGFMSLLFFFILYGSNKKNLAEKAGPADKTLNF